MMKRYILLILCAVLCIVLLGCSTLLSAQSDATVNTTNSTLEPEPAPHVLAADYTFPRGTKLLGTDVGSMTVAEAYAAVNDALSQYDLTVTVNGATQTLAGSSYELHCTEDVIVAYATALDAGEDTNGILQVSYSEPLLRIKVSRFANTPAQNATIVFNAETGLYELVAGSVGADVDIDSVMGMLDTAIRAQRPSLNVTVAEQEVLPAISENSAVARKALEKANSYLTTILTYNFILDDGSIHSETISPETIVSLMDFDENLNGYVKSATLMHYIESLNENYGYRGVEGLFKTKSGKTTEFNVIYYAQALDMAALHDDISYNLENAISRTQFVPYLEELVPSDIPYNGDYIEIDLSAQRLWLYQGGECVLDTPIVTGCVANYWNTPTGVYNVNRKRVGAILVGEDYETWVNYWMPFYRGYGLHDAYWRGTFGGNEYLYNGSHGCVNIPSENAKILYNYISVGTTVILYGGATNSEPVEQQILGTDTYNATIYTEPFTLDANLAYGSNKLTYTSSNPSVASVSEDGTVTIHRTGTVQIRVDSEESRYYTGATLRIKLTVEDPCGDVHTFGPWQQTTAPSCAEGEVARSCTGCTKTERVALPAIAAHTYEEWTEIKEPDCTEGEESSNCTVCGHTETRVLPPEHSFRSWKETTEPTCEAPGENTRTCRWCSYEETEVIPATGHDFSDDEEFCENDCGTANPAYVPPKDESEED